MMRTWLMQMRAKASKPRARAHAGETLAETLVAVLVASLAALVLMGSVGVAADLNARAEATDRALASDQLQVEARQGAAAQSQAVLVDEAGGVLGTYDIEVYEGDEGKYRSYGKAGA